MTINKSGQHSFVVYETFCNSVKFLPDEMRLKMYDAIFQYGLYEQIADDLSDVELAILTPIMFGIDQAKKRRETNKENGSKAGNKEGNQNARKEKKCTACIYYRKCTKTIFADSCNEYVVKNENERKQAKSSKNDLNVNVDVNVNDIRASVLNEPCSIAADSSKEEFDNTLKENGITIFEKVKVNEDIYSEEFINSIPF